MPRIHSLQTKATLLTVAFFSLLGTAQASLEYFTLDVPYVPDGLSVSNPFLVDTTTWTIPQANLVLTFSPAIPGTTGSTLDFQNAADTQISVPFGFSTFLHGVIATDEGSGQTYKFRNGGEIATGAGYTDPFGVYQIQQFFPTPEPSPLLVWSAIVVVVALAGWRRRRAAV